MPATRQASASPTAAVPRRGPESPDPPELRVRRLEARCDPERAFVHLYGRSENAFWLDSARGGPRGRFSFMGDASGPLAAVVTYELGADANRDETGAGKREAGGRQAGAERGRRSEVRAGRVRVERGGEAELLEESIFDYLDRAARRPPRRAAELPFDFGCGFAGYLGYELKADCGGEAAHESPLPDAAFVFADRMLAFDHVERCTWLLCLAQPDGGAEAESWLEETSQRLATLPPLPQPRHLRKGERGGGRAGTDGHPPSRPGPVEPAPFRLCRDRARYHEDVAACKRRLRAGESYEICLTGKVLGETAVEPLELYRALRRANPAPFGAFLRFGDTAVLSSSPERFLRIGRDRWAEARPIKGTSRRGASAAEDARLASALGADPKSRAENVTIVDLMRNDLGRVCEPGSVHVPELMRVESFETVHQLVSSVRGRLRDGAGPVDCVRACFPPGSMTGAPKLRTMEIIDELEGEARGPYSGAIGYLGLGGGCDLSVAIRTVVLDGESATIGAGGAIVLDSDPEREHAEMLLKAAAPLAAMGRGAAISFSACAPPAR
jgi:para-aminobenzoate synthetase